MRKLNLEPSEIIRRFLISSGFKGRCVIISPIKNLVALRRLAFYPYTHGETPWMTICDLSKFADVVAVTEEPNGQDELQLICRIAECSMNRYDYSLRIYLHRYPLPLILISDREAVRGDILVSVKEEEYRNVLNEAKKIIEKSREVDYGMYLELLDRVRR
ncbi:MAG: hypothetical protein ACO2PM_23810 [Pyrobaculum sp.]|jgi:hypothetical protein